MRKVHLFAFADLRFNKFCKGAGILAVTECFKNACTCCAKICLARLFLRACETRDFGGSRIAVSRTRKPIHLDRSDWLFEVGDLLRSLERFWDLESSIPSFRIPKFGSLAWLTLADVLLQPCYKGS